MSCLLILLLAVEQAGSLMAGIADHVGVLNTLPVAGRASDQRALAQRVRPVSTAGHDGVPMGVHRSSSSRVTARSGRTSPSPDCESRSPRAGRLG